MKILVANLGSTSFKYRLFDLTTESQLARGGIDRIGGPESRCTVEIGSFKDDVTAHVPDHAVAVKFCLEQLTAPGTGCLKDAAELDGIGFKAVMAGNLSGVRRVDDALLAGLERYAAIAPAHNPPYAKAMRQLQGAFPRLPQVAALETAFHETIPPELRAYAVPHEWQSQYGIQRWGFHGASHRFISQRIAQLKGRSDLKVISCHLGGSNSLCAIKNGESQSNTLGMSPQTGLPHNNRVGDFDPFALPILLQETGKTLPEILDTLANKSGLLGLSGLSGDVRDLENAAATGHERADLALKVFTQSIRQYIGAYLTILNGADAIVFTGGIGENSARIRKDVCSGMDFAGIEIDLAINETLRTEGQFSTPASKVELWVIPTNEELVVARQTAELLSQTK
jgi:acetate kinase